MGKRLTLTVLFFLLCAATAFAEPPQFTDCPAIRRVDNLGTWLADIESRMPAGHIYRDADVVTWAHETTHGLNSRLRNARRAGVNCLYVLNGQAVVIEEPSIRLSDVAATVPEPLRGDVYRLYLVQQQRYWQNEPLYVLDEWVAYANGSLVAMEWGVDRGDSLQFAMEFTAYAFALCAAVERHNQRHGRPYDDRQLKAFVSWHARRVLWMYGEVQAGRYPMMRRAGQGAYFARMREAQALNEFCAWYLGWDVRGWKPANLLTGGE